MSIFKVWEKKKETRGKNNSFDSVEMFKQFLSVIAHLEACGSPRETRAWMRKEYKFTSPVASTRFKGALEIQQWLKDEHLTFGYDES